MLYVAWSKPSGHSSYALYSYILPLFQLPTSPKRISVRFHILEISQSMEHINSMNQCFALLMIQVKVIDKSIINPLRNPAIEIFIWIYLITEITFQKAFHGTIYLPQCLEMRKDAAPFENTSVIIILIKTHQNYHLFHRIRLSEMSDIAKANLLPPSTSD